MSEQVTEHWYEKAADAIVREGWTLFKFCNESDLGISSRECEQIQRSKAFQDVLRARRNVYHKELANDPTLTKATMEGQLIVAINGLMVNGAYDKAANVIMQFAKLRGWSVEQTSVNIFNDLRNGDISKLKAELAKKAASALPN